MSLLCSHPLPDRFVEMKIIKQLLDQGKIPLLKAVVRRVVTVSSTVVRKNRRVSKVGRKVGIC